MTIMEPCCKRARCKSIYKAAAISQKMSDTKEMRSQGSMLRPA